MRSMRMTGNSKKSKGFTLIELMIAIAIVAIIASVALSSYSSSVDKTRRKDCMATLNQLGQYMERFYTTNGSYEDAADADGNPVGFPGSCPTNGTTVYYDLEVDIPSPNTYILYAIPNSASMSSGQGRIELHSTGRKGWDINASSASVGDPLDDEEWCWEDSCS